MITERELFLKNLAQTSDFPMMLEVDKAEGIFLIDRDGKKYIDLISGISVSNTGHRNPVVIEAIKNQLDNHLHAMVYGEFIQSPQTRYATRLIEYLPDAFEAVYFVNSGSEANEGALKLAKRYTGRYEVISFQNAYHGSTQGVLSVIGSEYYKNAFRPLIPGVKTIRFNNFEDIALISEKTACVIIEPIQAEGGVRLPDPDYLKVLRERCHSTGTLLIFDEAQTAFGRTGHMFAFQKYNVIPDILTLSKGFGGGMPLGAFISSHRIMNSLKDNPVLGHITTFGGHPVSCAAGLANFEFIIHQNLLKNTQEKSKVFEKYLHHPKIEEIRGTGLLFAVQLSNFEQVRNVIKSVLKKGVVTDWFLFCNNAIRIAPPLIIEEDEIMTACTALIEAINENEP